jgi:hypothetical protein
VLPSQLVGPALFAWMVRRSHFPVGRKAWPESSRAWISSAFSLFQRWTEKPPMPDHGQAPQAENRRCSGCGRSGETTGCMSWLRSRAHCSCCACSPHHWTYALIARPLRHRGMCPAAARLRRISSVLLPSPDVDGRATASPSSCPLRRYASQGICRLSCRAKRGRAWATRPYPAMVMAHALNFTWMQMDTTRCRSQIASLRAFVPQYPSRLGIQ